MHSRVIVSVGVWVKRIIGVGRDELAGVWIPFPKNLEISKSDIYSISTFSPSSSHSKESRSDINYHNYIRKERE